MRETQGSGVEMSTMERRGSPVLIRVDRTPETRSGHPRHIHPPLQLKYIQAGLQDELGVRAPLLDGWIHRWSPADVVNEVLPLTPRIAAVAASSTCIDEAVAVGRSLREAGILTIAIGQQVTHMTRRMPPGWSGAFDFSILGEPEQEVVRLTARLQAEESAGELSRHYRGLVERQEVFRVENPDELPRPLFEPEELQQYPFPFPVRRRRLSRWGYILTSWGCPHACTHCTEVLRKTTGAELRRRAPARILDEVESLLATGAHGIIFEDDTFFYDREHILGICSEIDRRGLRFPWIAHARADDLSAETVAAARRTGAVLLKIGVESGSRRTIERLGKTPNSDTWAADVERGFGLLREHGIGAVAMFMVGCPEEDLSDVEQSMELALRLDPDYLQVQIFCPYPDIRYFGALGAAPADKTASANLYHYNDPSWTLSRIPPERLKPVQTAFYRRFYLRPGFVIRHLRRHWRHYAHPGTMLLTSVGLAARAVRSG